MQTGQCIHAPGCYGLPLAFAFWWDSPERASGTNWRFIESLKRFISFSNRTLRIFDQWKWGADQLAFSVCVTSSTPCTHVLTREQSSPQRLQLARIRLANSRRQFIKNTRLFLPPAWLRLWLTNCVQSDAHPSYQSFVHSGPSPMSVAQGSLGGKLLHL